MARSRTASVHLHFEAWFENSIYDCTRRSTYSCIPRAHTIGVYVMSSPIDTMADSIAEIGIALQSYEGADVRVLHLEHDHRMPIVQDPILLPNLFLGLTPSHLHTLRLEGFSVSCPNALWSSSITSLTLSNSLVWSNIDEMVQVFRATPFLESFEYTNTDRVFDVGFDTTLSQTTPLRSAFLPKLRSFTVEADLEDVTVIFAYLHISDDCTLTLTYNEPVAFTHLSEQNVHARHVEYMNLGASAMWAHHADAIQGGFVYDRVTLSYWVLLAYRNGSKDDDACITINVPSTGHITEIITPVPSYLQCPVFSRTTTFCIHGMLTEVFKFQDLLCFEVVRDLELLGEAAAVFWGGITGNPVYDWQEEGDVVPCRPFPAVERIHIVGFNFTAWSGNRTEETDVPENFASLLADALREAYLPLETFQCVILERCTANEGEVEVFKRSLGDERVRIVELDTDPA